jgi:hypothetical protein
VEAGPLILTKHLVVRGKEKETFVGDEGSSVDTIGRLLAETEQVPVLKAKLSDCQQ